MPEEEKNIFSGPRRIQGVLVEFPGVMVDVRRALADAFPAALAGNADAVTPGFLCRHLRFSSPAAVSESAAGELGLRAPARDSLRKALGSALAQALKGEPDALRPGAPDLLQKLSQTGLTVALCGADEAVMQSSLAGAGLDTLGIVLAPWASGGAEPFSEGWILSVRKIGLPAGSCMALVSSAESGHGAMVAGLRCVGVPDRYTAHHDFGGADGVFEEIGEIDLDPMLQGSGSA